MSDDAYRRVHEFLCEHIELEPRPPTAGGGTRGADTGRTRLFTFRLFGDRGRLGAEELVAIDLDSDEIRYLGYVDE